MMDTPLLVMPATALFLALSWYTRPGLLAILVSMVYLALLIATVRAWRSYRRRPPRQGWQRSAPRLLTCLLLTTLSIAYPLCKRNHLTLLMTTDDVSRHAFAAHWPNEAVPRPGRFYARPRDVRSAVLRESGAPCFANRERRVKPWSR